ncbi:MAG TPA: TRAP transporter large permease [Burkholderiales bacterium]|nr:TRAP transporter large permease [Burkholderiales bacterium]
MQWALAVLPIVLLVLGYPFFVILLAAASVALIFVLGMPSELIHQQIFAALDKYALIAIPFFIFAGDLMARGGIAQRLVRWVASMVGGVRGYLPQTALGTTIVFSAISGSTTASVAAVGSMTYDKLREAGYRERFASGLIVSAAAIDNLIPPSVGFILYSVASDTSLLRLFTAGIVPGILLGAAFAIYIYAHAVSRGESAQRRFERSEFAAATRDGIWSIAAPVVVLGGLYAGIFSPTEAAGIACVYAILVVAVIHREMGWREILASAARTAVLTSQVFIIVAMAGIYSWLLTVSGTSDAAGRLIGELNAPPFAILLAINVLLLLVGTCIDTASAILVLTPVLLPIAVAIGLDPVHFGVILVMNLSLGTFTPPIGVNLFVAQAVFRANVREMYLGVMPFFLVALVVLQLVTYLPSLSLWAFR